MLPEGLLEATRNYLDITWTGDTAGDVKLSGILARGMAYLDLKSGTALDYTAEDLPRQLLLDYCLYAQSNALDEFDRNYLSMLLALQQREEVSAYVIAQAAIIP